MRALLLAALFALPISSLAQTSPEHIFSKNERPPMRSEMLDKLFKVSRVNHMLTQGTEETACLHLAGGLLTLLAEVAPTLHKRDENFQMAPQLIHSLQTQLSTPRFPAGTYLGAMVRRVLIEGKMPAEWLATAKKVNARYQIIDLAKLEFLSEGTRPIDSVYFTVPELRARYEVEVAKATQSARGTAQMAFRDRYLDRRVAWTGMTLEELAPAKDGKGLVAYLSWEPEEKGEEDLHPNLALIMKKKKAPSRKVRVTARLDDRQYIDLYSLPKGRRVMVRGRLWKMSKNAKQLELRNALLFQDRDWSNGAVLADPRQVAQCSAALNELTGSRGGRGLR